MRRNRRLRDDAPLAIRGSFAAGLVAFAFLLQFTTPNLGSVDGYFHIRYSALLGEFGWRHFPPPFPWLPLTILSPDRYFDHHMLFHLWLVPFTAGDLVLGAKVAAAIGAAAAFLGAYLFLLGQRVRRAEWWMIAVLAGAPGFLYRMEMPRVQAWSLVCLLVALALLLRRRDAWLLPLAWGYTWLYDAFPFLLALCGCSALAHGLLHRDLRWQPLAYATAGVAGGLLVNPYVPHNLRFIAHHYLAKLRTSDAIPVGREWSALPVAEWLGWGGLIAILVAAGVLSYRYRRGLDAGALTAILAAGLFFALLWRSARFVEYFVPFLGIALAMTLHARLDAAVRRLAPRWRRGLAGALLLWLAITTAVAAVQLRGRPPASRFAAAARWLQSHTPAGSMVFNAGWDDFPLLYFHNPANTYVVGLDPTYLAEREPARYWQWRRIGAGEVAQPARAIQDHFGAAVALTDHANAEFIAAMDRDPAAERAYEDADCIVYRLAPAAAAGRGGAPGVPARADGQ